MKYIGITGHRGSGKATVAFLVGNILEHLRKNSDYDEIKDNFSIWCEQIKNNNNILHDTMLYYVYFDEFGDVPKSFVSQLLGIDMHILDSDTLKDTMYVNLKDFSLSADVDKESIVTPDDYMESVPQNKPKLIRRLKTDTYMNLRDFMKMFSVDIMQRFFGTNVWIKSMVRYKDKYGEVDTGWRIFSDVKLGDEYQYIKTNDGVVINVQRPSNKKKERGINNIEQSDVWDYNVFIESDVSEMFDELYKIAKDIYER